MQHVQDVTIGVILVYLSFVLLHQDRVEVNHLGGFDLLLEIAQEDLVTRGSHKGLPLRSIPGDTDIFRPFLGIPDVL